MSFKFIIPARRNSKGLPFKNRKLFDIFLDKTPENLLTGLIHSHSLIVSTDDESIIEKCVSKSINYLNRDSNLALDTTSTKEVMIDLYNKNYIFNDDIVVMLYLTYPERNWDDIGNAIDTFVKNGSRSLLCKKEITSTHPYLYMLEIDKNKGKQLVAHDLYRRQDYPKVFEISHYICIFKGGELKNLNNNLYNEDTFFLPINSVIDVDTENDLLKYNGNL